MSPLSSRRLFLQQQSSPPGFSKRSVSSSFLVNGLEKSLFIVLSYLIVLAILKLEQLINLCKAQQREREIALVKRQEYRSLCSFYMTIGWLKLFYFVRDLTCYSLSFK